MAYYAKQKITITLFTMQKTTDSTDILANPILFTSVKLLIKSHNRPMHKQPEYAQTWQYDLYR